MGFAQTFHLLVDFSGSESQLENLQHPVKRCLDVQFVATAGEAGPESLVIKPIKSSSRGSWDVLASTKVSKAICRMKFRPFFD